jgi:hypothetical protein
MTDIFDKFKEEIGDKLQEVGETVGQLFDRDRESIVDTCGMNSGTQQLT